MGVWSCCKGVNSRYLPLDKFANLVVFPLPLVGPAIPFIVIFFEPVLPEAVGSVAAQLRHGMRGQGSRGCADEPCCTKILPPRSKSSF